MFLRKWLKNSCQCVVENYQKVFVMICLSMTSISAFADSSDGVIPISADDQTQSGHNFAQTIITIFKKDIIPVLMLIAGVFFVWSAITTMTEGLKESKEMKNNQPLKDAVVRSAILLVVGGSLIYLLYLITQHTF